MGAVVRTLTWSRLLMQVQAHGSTLISYRLGISATCGSLNQVDRVLPKPAAYRNLLVFLSPGYDSVGNSPHF
jgi:hypothetical protein